MSKTTSFDQLSEIEALFSSRIQTKTRRCFWKWKRSHHCHWMLSAVQWIGSHTHVVSACICTHCYSLCDWHVLFGT